MLAQPTGIYKTKKRFNMIDYELNIKNYKKLNLKIDGLYIKRVYGSTEGFFLEEDVKKLINYFNEEYKWDKMFDIDDVRDRIYRKHSIYVLYFNEQPIGYFFIEPFIKEKFTYLYNLYVTNIVKRPDLSPIWFVNNSIPLVFRDEWCKKITCKCDDWNMAAQNVFIKNNFTTKSLI